MGKTKVLILYSKHFTHRVASTAPSACILFLTPLQLLYNVLRDTALDFFRGIDFLVPFLFKMVHGQV